MNKFSTPTKKDFLKFLNKFNIFLGDKLALLTKKNFKQLLIELIYDRRFVITVLIAILSIFAHLSTPAFYQDKWVLSKIKKQLKNEFDVELILPKEVRYSIFPIPSFNLKNVKVFVNGNGIGIIDEMKVNLTFNKFLNKEKINIQNIKIKNSKFDIYSKEIKNLINFFDKKINDKKLFIEKSKVFLKNNSDEVFLIFNINESISYFDNNLINNLIDLKGEVFGIPVKANISNNYLTKFSNFSLEFQKIGKKINAKIDYLKKKQYIFLEIIDGSNSYVTNFELNKNFLTFESGHKYEEGYRYNGYVNFKPFFSKSNIYKKNIDLIELFHNDNLLSQILNSDNLSNPNLNYEIELKSEKIKNHRLLKNFIFNLSFDQRKFVFDDTKINFDDNVSIRVENSEFISNNKEKYFYGELIFDIDDSNKLYKFFQTKKNFRKRLKKINLVLKYDLTNSTIFIERLYVNKQSNDELQNIISTFNDEKFNYTDIRRIEFKKYFNKIASSL